MNRENFTQQKKKIFFSGNKNLKRMLSVPHMSTESILFHFQKRKIMLTSHADSSALRLEYFPLQGL